MANIRQEIAAWVVTCGSSLMFADDLRVFLTKNGVRFIQARDFADLEQLVLTGAFRVAVIEAAPDEIPDGWGTDETEFVRFLGNAKWPINATVVFGRRVIEQEAENVVYSNLGDEETWDLVIKMAQIPRPYPNFNLPDNAISQSFELPPIIADAAAQYLIFFRRFLQTIGIEATTTTQSTEAGKILFSVEPNDPNVALETIYDALSIYLKLPKYTIVNDNQPSSQDDRINALQLNNEIEDLKGKLRVASMIMETKDATISAKAAEVRATEAQLTAMGQQLELKQAEVVQLNNLVENTHNYSRELQVHSVRLEAILARIQADHKRQAEELEQKESIISNLLKAMVADPDAVAQIDLTKLIIDLRNRKSHQETAE